MKRVSPVVGSEETRWLAMRPRTSSRSEDDITEGEARQSGCGEGEGGRYADEPGAAAGGVSDLTQQVGEGEGLGANGVEDDIAIGSGRFDSEPCDIIDVDGLELVVAPSGNGKTQGSGGGTRRYC